MASNGGKSILITIAVVSGIVIPIVFFGSNHVIANDKKNTTEHTEIRKDISDFSVEQMRQGTILKRIDEKVKTL